MRKVRNSSRGTAKRRRRLDPDVRREQILSAALVEFASRGFATALMEDIARRAGLSKGGLYAHFKSKDEVFEALLRRSLRPPEVDVSVWQEGRSGRDVIALLVEDLYRALARKDVVETLRLLIAEAPRVSDLVERWRADVIAGYEQRIGRVLQEGIRKKRLRRGIVTDEVWLFVVPVLRPIFMQMLNDPRGTAAYLAHQQDAHIEAMCELLLPPDKRRP